MSACICDATINRECVYHGILHAPTRTTLRRLWPIREPSTESPSGLRDYWRCFHCDFHTTSRAEAEAHFGDRDDAEEFKPICKWWSWMDEGERRAQFQAVILELNAERNKP